MFKGRRQKREIQQLAVDINVLRLKKLKQVFETWSNIPEKDPDESTWRQVAQAGRSLARGELLDLNDLEGLRSASRMLAQTNSHYKGILRNMVNYIVGNGIAIEAHKDDPRKEAHDEAWRIFRARNGWILRSKEIVWRGFRDGEVFCRLFPGEPPTLRIIDPEHITDPTDAATYGIKTEPQDVETILAYMYQRDLSRPNVDLIPAKYMKHLKLGMDSNQKRGVPVFWSELQKLQDVETWLNYLLTYLKVATAVVLIRKYEGLGPSEIQAHVEAMTGGGTEYDANLKQNINKWFVEPGTVLDVGAGQSYEWQSPGLDARPLVEGLRRFLLSIAAGANQTEVMVTADASNANYSSNMVAEAPPIKGFQSWQQVFGDFFVSLYRWVNNMPVDYHPAPTYTAPMNIARDELKETKAAEIRFQHGVMSRTTWQKRDGLDPDEEKANVESEEAESFADADRKNQMAEIPDDGEPDE